jgi:hypothetical protein
VTDVDFTESDEPVTKKIDLLSLNVLSLVDRFCFLAPFNCRMTLEAQVPIDHRRSAYKTIKSIIESDEECKQFRDAWIDWVRANPPEPESGDEVQVSKWNPSIYGDSDDSEMEVEPAAMPTAKGQSRNVDNCSLAAIAKKAGAGIHDNDILPEGTSPGHLDEDNERAAAEGQALATGRRNRRPRLLATGRRNRRPRLPLLLRPGLPLLLLPGLLQRPELAEGQAEQRFGMNYMSLSSKLFISCLYLVCIF